MGIRDNVKKLILPILGGGNAPQPTSRSAMHAERTPRPQAATPRSAPPAPPRDSRFASPPGRGDKPVAEYIEATVKGAPVVLFMKGSPLAPQCGFSAGASGILAEYGVKLTHVDVLADPEVREGVKQYTSWPTIPQVFIGGEFVGGADILKQMHEAGDLKPMIEAAVAALAPASATPAEA